MPRFPRLVVPNYPHDKNALSAFFSKLHQRYALRTNLKHEWRGHLWQERFYSVVMDESHTMSAMRYVEPNPVRANLLLSADPLIDSQATQKIISNWAEYLAEEESADDLRSIRKQTGSGRPGGDARFIESIELISGRCVRTMRKGRRSK